MERVFAAGRGILHRKFLYSFLLLNSRSSDFILFVFPISTFLHSYFLFHCGVLITLSVFLGQFQLVSFHSNLILNQYIFRLVPHSFSMLFSLFLSHVSLVSIAVAQHTNNVGPGQDLVVRQHTLILSFNMCFGFEQRGCGQCC